MIHKFHRRRIILCFLLVFGGFFVAVVRMYQIQIQQKDFFALLGDKVHVKRIPIRPPRGKIFSSSGNVLAQSIPVHSLCADPTEISDPSGLVRLLSGILDAKEAKDLQENLRTKPRTHPIAGKGENSSRLEPSSTRAPSGPPAPPPGFFPEGLRALILPGGISRPPPLSERTKIGVRSQFCWVKRKLDARTYEAVLQLIKTHKIKGLGFRKEYKRVYPNNQILSQVLGFVNLDEVGLEGLEYQFNRLLNGKPGVRIVVRGPNGMPIQELARQKPEGFYDVYLTIDHVIQYCMERELDKAYAKYSPKNCFAAAIEPNTGEILAMASRPTYDPNNYRAYSRDLYKNRVATDTFEPGSTFKVVTAAAALEEHRVEPPTTFNCPGKIILWDIPIRCTSTHNDVSLEQIIERSCNTGIIKVGELLGPRNLYYYIRKFGFGEKTGVDLPLEGDGLVYQPDRWSGLSIGAVSMGQELTVTGIQMLTGISVIANGGRLLRPQIIKKVVDPETGAVVQDFSMDIRRRVISPKTTELMTKMMSLVTKSGTGTLAALDDYVVAGKTGTSEKLGRSKEQGNLQYVASFIGFLPAKEPKVLIYVVLNEPKEPKGEKVRGGTMAGPVFREIARQIMLLQKIPPEPGVGTPVVPVSHETPSTPKEEETDPSQETAGDGEEPTETDERPGPTTQSPGPQVDSTVPKGSPAPSAPPSQNPQTPRTEEESSNEPSDPGEDSETDGD